MPAFDYLRYFLAAEFLIGGQCRVTSVLTPWMHEFVMEKAPHFYDNLRFIPGNTPREQMRALGTVMCLGAVWLAKPGQSPASRQGSLLLAEVMSTVILVGEYTIGGDTWLPTANIVLGGWLLIRELTKNVQDKSPAGSI